MNDLQTSDLTSSKSKPALSPDGSPLPTAWIERLFDRLTAIAGSAMATVYAGADPALVKAEWAEALAGFTAAEVQRGIAATRTRRYPPNLPEFLHLCRPALDPETAWVEAERGLMAYRAQQAFVWSHPAVYWAASEMSFELQGSTFAQCRKRWEAVLASMWSLKAWPAPPDPTAVRIEHHEPEVVANPQRVRRELDRLKQVRQELAGRPLIDPFALPSVVAVADEEARRRDSQERQAQVVRDYAAQKGIAL